MDSYVNEVTRMVCGVSYFEAEWYNVPVHQLKAAIQEYLLDRECDVEDVECPEGDHLIISFSNTDDPTPLFYLNSTCACGCACDEAVMFFMPGCRIIFDKEPDNNFYFPEGQGAYISKPGVAYGSFLGHQMYPHTINFKDNFKPFSNGAFMGYVDLINAISFNNPDFIPLRSITLRADGTIYFKHRNYDMAYNITPDLPTIIVR